MNMVRFSFRQRIGFLVGLLALAGGGIAMLEPIPQDPGYHQFADNRLICGIPNFSDVVSNFGFALVGALGLLLVVGAKCRTVFVRSEDVRPYLFFFTGVVLISLGSAYYHWSPSNERLFWDRLPISIVFMSLSSALVADRIHTKTGNGWLLFLLVFLGAASLIYWVWTESLGQGDLRLYAFVQFYPVIALPAVVLLFPQHHYTNGRYLAWMIVWYLLSKGFEHFDGEVFESLAHTVSGHTLKHLFATASAYAVLKMLWSSAAVTRLAVDRFSSR